MQGFFHQFLVKKQQFVKGEANLFELACSH